MCTSKSVCDWNNEQVKFIPPQHLSSSSTVKKIMQYTIVLSSNFVNTVYISIYFPP